MSCGIVGKVGTGAKQESEDKPRKGSHGSGSGKGKEMSKAARRKAAAVESDIVSSAGSFHC